MEPRARGGMDEEEMSRIKNLSRAGWMIVGIVVTLILVPSGAAMATIANAGIEGRSAYKANVPPGLQLLTNAVTSGNTFPSTASFTDSRHELRMAGQARETGGVGVRGSSSIGGSVEFDDSSFEVLPGSLVSLHWSTRNRSADVARSSLPRHVLPSRLLVRLGRDVASGHIPIPNMDDQHRLDDHRRRNDGGHSGGRRRWDSIHGRARHLRLNGMLEPRSECCAYGSPFSHQLGHPELSIQLFAPRHQRRSRPTLRHDLSDF